MAPPDIVQDLCSLGAPAITEGLLGLRTYKDEQDVCFPGPRDGLPCRCHPSLEKRLLVRKISARFKTRKGVGLGYMFLTWPVAWAVSMPWTVSMSWAVSMPWAVSVPRAVSVAVVLRRHTA